MDRSRPPLAAPAQANAVETIESPAIEHSGRRQSRAVVTLVTTLASFLLLLIGLGMEGASLLVVAIAALLWMIGPGRTLIERVWPGPFRAKAGTVSRWNDALALRAGDKQEILRSAQLTEVKLRPLERKVELVLDTGKTATFEAPRFERVAHMLDLAKVPGTKRTYVAKLGREPAESMVPWVVSVAASVGLGLGFGLGSATPVIALWLVPVIATFAYFVATKLGSPDEIALGASGITLASPGNRRFFHYGGLRDVRLDPSRLRIFTDNGQEVSAKIEGLDTAAREQIEAWVQDRRQAFASTSAGTDAYSVLDRHGRSLEAWRAALKTVLSQEGQYRKAPISAEDLAGLLVNPHTPAERRIAAAFILSENQTTMTHKQIRFAAESSSSQPMRIALRALAEEKIEEDAIEEALAAETGSGAR